MYLLFDMRIIIINYYMRYVIVNKIFYKCQYQQHQALTFFEYNVLYICVEK